MNDSNTTGFSWKPIVFAVLAAAAAGGIAAGLTATLASLLFFEAVWFGQVVRVIVAALASGLPGGILSHLILRHDQNRLGLISTSSAAGASVLSLQPAHPIVGAVMLVVVMSAAAATARITSVKKTWYVLGFAYVTAVSLFMMNQSRWGPYVPSFLAFLLAGFAGSTAIITYVIVTRTGSLSDASKERRARTLEDLAVGAIAGGLTCAIWEAAVELRFFAGMLRDISLIFAPYGPAAKLVHGLSAGALAVLLWRGQRPQWRIPFALAGLVIVALIAIGAAAGLGQSYDPLQYVTLTPLVGSGFISASFVLGGAAGFSVAVVIRPLLRLFGLSDVVSKLNHDLRESILFAVVLGILFGAAIASAGFTLPVQGHVWSGVAGGFLGRLRRSSKPSVWGSRIEFVLAAALIGTAGAFWKMHFSTFGEPVPF